MPRCRVDLLRKRASAEVCPSSANSPEQVGIFSFTCPNQPTVSGNSFRRSEALYREIRPPTTDTINR